jgi:hypothetical protein
LEECIARSSEIRTAVAGETPVLREAVHWLKTTP